MFRRSIGEQIGLTLKHAGVSITVTSFTDIVASTIGGTTVSIHCLHTHMHKHAHIVYHYMYIQVKVLIYEISVVIVIRFIEILF